MLLPVMGNEGSKVGEKSNVIARKRPSGQVMDIIGTSAAGSLLGSSLPSCKSSLVLPLLNLAATVSTEDSEINAVVNIY
jgi:hypothetical protein